MTTVYGYDVSFTAGTLSTDSFEKSDLVKAYPNPTNDIVTVSLPDAAVVEKIAVYNSLGQLMLTEAKSTVSLQHLAKGTYYLTIYTSEGNFAKKIIKK
ncbi:Por secretion system C-terminal sorting domain-containing protein [Flavobacterium fluvii]|uniref:Por secretion system C-terminal sorting domain-containing protein n=1 Tax=Flavobacterium fluvii TaxID=468056 RepID=A0A1M5JY24_9FLAO|nr:T9SS type A sorting domain-containing protein [Flavobacterium fluvii]SHG45418.1 Por secretion system C-terminal sorting domain-containing protein [Flavobacterium fluvii]